jgi:trimethylamine monooxygenase
VATGHYSFPRIPVIKGQETFKGQIIHSHDIREFKQFKDKNIVVIGGFLSA